MTVRARALSAEDEINRIDFRKILNNIRKNIAKISAKYPDIFETGQSEPLKNVKNAENYFLKSKSIDEKWLTCYNFCA